MQAAAKFLRLRAVTLITMLHQDGAHMFLEKLEPGGIAGRRGAQNAAWDPGHSPPQAR
jgi:hypothetical protein